VWRRHASTRCYFLDERRETAHGFHSSDFEQNQAARIARAGTPVLIVEVGTESAAAALRGEVPPVCTVIEAAS